MSFPRRLPASSAAAPLLLLLPTSCIGGEADRDVSAESVLEWRGVLHLEETDSAINADPELSPDPRGGFIVVDRQTQQVRLYDPGGGLRGWFGSEGPGPAQFDDLIDATRDRRGRLVALTHQGKISLWSPRGDSLVEVRTAPTRAAAIVPFDDGVAVAALPLNRPDELEVSVLHVLGSGDGVDATPVRARVTENDVTAFFSVGLPSVEGVGPIKAVTVPIVDSIWVVEETSENAVATLPVPSALLAGNAPPVNPFEDREGFFDWMQDSWFVEAAFPLPDEGGWLVSLWHPADSGSRWALVRMNAEGDLVWETEDVPRLVAVEPDGGLVFDDPDSAFPNHFRLARLTSSQSSR